MRGSMTDRPVSFWSRSARPRWLRRSAPMDQDPGEEAIELVRTVAGVLEDAHRLGLAHGRLGPGQVFLVDGRPRLDFTGIDAGFPVGSTSARMLDRLAAIREPVAARRPIAPPTSMVWAS